MGALLLKVGCALGPESQQEKRSGFLKLKEEGAKSSLTTEAQAQGGMGAMVRRRI